MSNFDDYITDDQGGIPWVQAAAFFVELKDIAVPEPVLTKEAKAGLLKLAHIRKVAQTPEEAQDMTQQAAMTDPNIVAATDYQEMAAERAALQQTVQGMQQQLMQSAQTQQAAEQQVQQMAANTEALQGQLEQANAGRQQAIEQAVQSKDQALSEVVNQQQHRAQIMQAADQLTAQLKQVAATSPNEQMAQQQQAAAEQEAAVGQGQVQGQGGQPGSAKAKKETQEAQQASVNAQVQGEQAQAAQQEDAAKQQAAQQQAVPGQDPATVQALQQQQGAAGAPMPKQGSARGEVGGFFRTLQRNPNSEEVDAAVTQARKEGKPMQTFDDVTTYVDKVRKTRQGASPLNKQQILLRELAARQRAGRGFGGRSIQSEGREARQASRAGQGPGARYNSVKEAAERLRMEKRAGNLGATYRLGRAEVAIRHLAGKADEGVKSVSIRDLPLSQRVAWHLGKHRGKYLAGAGIGTTTTAAAVGAKVLKDQKEKRAYFYLKDNESTAAERPKRHVAHPEWDRKIAQQRRDHFENFIAMAERKKGKPLTKVEADAVIQTYNKVTGETVPLTKEWRHGSLPYAHFEKTAAPLGTVGRLAYAGGGAALGAGHAALEQVRHGKKFGKGQASSDEIDRKADLMAAQVKMKRDPTYLNKLRFSSAQYKASLEQADRQHPGGAIARGAIKGGLIGAIGGQAAHSLGGWTKALVKARGAAAKAAK